MKYTITEMKAPERKTRPRTFEDVCFGEMFKLAKEHNEKIYLRIDSIYDFNNEECYNAVDIEYGKKYYFEEDELVSVYNGDLQFNSLLFTDRIIDTDE